MTSRSRLARAMRMSDVVSVCERLGIVPDAGPLGVRVGSTGWRLECGGGIAGNGGVWWLSPIAGMLQGRSLGPATTRRELAAVLRSKWPTQIKNMSPRPNRRKPR